MRSISRLKQDAKKLAKEKDIPLNIALNLIAQQLGCSTWNILKENYANQEKCLWLLTEEKPKNTTIDLILRDCLPSNISEKFFGYKVKQINPIMNGNIFSFTYEIEPTTEQNYPTIYLKIVSGYSSFVDYLAFWQEIEPNQESQPISLIEETKTDDKESRNTGIYQRASKFILGERFYPNVNKYMLYTLRNLEVDEVSQTNQFGTKCFKTIGIKVIGKKERGFEAFTSIEELINFKAAMRSPPKGNVPILIKKISETEITISGRLVKADSLSHDPNIGALSLIASTLRYLGWSEKITIIEHGLEQKHIGKSKFISICHMLKLNLKDINLHVHDPIPNYWKYEEKGEKVASIFLHIILETYTAAISLFENHAGCEKSYYLISSKNCTHKFEALKKYSDRSKYKEGNKQAIISIPDLVILDNLSQTIVDIEGKTYKNMGQGIKELKAYDALDKEYNKKYYPNHSIERTVVLFGNSTTEFIPKEVGFILETSGKIHTFEHSPEIFKRAVSRLFSN